MTESIDPIATALLVVRHLDSLQIPHTIGGSIASSFAGEPRSTVDIDIVVALAAALSAGFYVDADALRRAIRTRSSTNLIHQATPLKVDLFIAGGTPLGARQIAPRLAVDLGDGRRLHVHPPEDILLQKLRWLGRASRRLIARHLERQHRAVVEPRARAGRPWRAGREPQQVVAAFLWRGGSRQARFHEDLAKGGWDSLQGLRYPVGHEHAEVGRLEFQ